MLNHSRRRRAGTVVALSMAAAGIVGLQAGHNVAQAKDTINPATGCGEDSFLSGAVSPSTGSPVTVPLGTSQTFSVVYHDESPINMNAGFAPVYTVTDSAGHVVQSGQPGTSPASAPAGTKDKFNTLVAVNYGPSAPGTYTLKIKAWDGDQNKTGGDCGVAVWSLNTPGTTTTAPPTTTTIPHNTTTTQANTTTTEPSTPQTNVLGETFEQSPAAPAVLGTPALTG